MFNVFNGKRDISSLVSDKYCFVMSNSYAEEGANDLVTFEMFIRSLPNNRGFFVTAGTREAVEAVENLKLTLDQAVWLIEEGIVSETFVAEFFSSVQMETLKMVLNAPAFAKELLLKTLGQVVWAKLFNGEIWAMAEGSIVAAQTPLLRVTGKRIECSLIEPMILSLINHQTMVASKVSRMILAAQGLPVIDMSLRRLHGPEASMGVVRAAFISGIAGSSNLEAARKYGIKHFGSVAHAYITKEGEAGELNTFKSFLISNKDRPANRTLLVDSFDTIQGVKKAIIASNETGISLTAIRLDSGDLSTYSKEARKLLDEAGFQDTKILASDDLDEYRVAELLADNAKLDIFGIGTRLGTGLSPRDSHGVSAISGVYKLTANHENGVPNVIKLGAAGSFKTTDPGVHQVYRVDGPGSDVLVLDDEDHTGTPLLEKWMENGKIIKELDSLDVARERCAQQLSELPEESKLLENPVKITLSRSQKLWDLRKELGDPDAVDLMAKDLQTV